MSPLCVFANLFSQLVPTVFRSCPCSPLQMSKDVKSPEAKGAETRSSTLKRKRRAVPGPDGAATSAPAASSSSSATGAVTSASAEKQRQGTLELLQCPIGREVMVVPALLPCGCAVEFSNICMWLQCARDHQKRLCPACRRPIHIVSPHDLAVSLAHVKLRELWMPELKVDLSKAFRPIPVRYQIMALFDAMHDYCQDLSRIPTEIRTFQDQTMKSIAEFGEREYVVKSSIRNPAVPGTVDIRSGGNLMMLTVECLPLETLNERVAQQAARLKQWHVAGDTFRFVFTKTDPYTPSASVGHLCFEGRLRVNTSQFQALLAAQAELRRAIAAFPKVVRLVIRCTGYTRENPTTALLPLDRIDVV